MLSQFLQRSFTALEKHRRSIQGIEQAKRMSEDQPGFIQDELFSLENLKEDEAQMVSVQITRLAEELGALSGDCAFKEVGYEAPTKDVIEARRNIMIQQSKFWSIFRQLTDYNKEGKVKLENRTQ